MARRSLHLALGGAAAAAALWAPGPGALLEVESPARGVVERIPLAEGETFSVTWRHSMYDAPVTEEYRIERGRLRLEVVSSPSPAALEYLALTGPGERQALSLSLPEVAYRVAMGTRQSLRAGGREISFHELGDRGDRIVLRPARGALPSALATWLDRDPHPRR